MEKYIKNEKVKGDEVDDDNHNQARNGYKMCVSNESSRLNDDSSTHIYKHVSFCGGVDL